MHGTKILICISSLFYIAPLSPIIQQLMFWIPGKQNITKLPNQEIKSFMTLFTHYQNAISFLIVWSCNFTRNILDIILMNFPFWFLFSSSLLWQLNQIKVFIAELNNIVTLLSFRRGITLKPCSDRYEIRYD